MKIIFERLASIALLAGVCLGSGVVQAAGPAHADRGLRAVQAPKSTPVPAIKLTTADRQKIQRIITLQIRAFERNDEAVAFSYATPNARRYFGTPRAFMEVVRASYASLYKNSSREFLEAAVIDGLVVQPLKILTSDGEIIVALYTVEQQADKEWRVGSCELAPSTLSAT